MSGAGPITPEEWDECGLSDNSPSKDPKGGPAEPVWKHIVAGIVLVGALIGLGLVAWLTSPSAPGSFPFAPWGKTIP